MRVAPPARWGKLMGTTRAAACDGGTLPLPGTTVQVDADGGSWTFDTDADGRYAYWLDTQVAKRLQLIAAKDGYQPRPRR